MKKFFLMLLSVFLVATICAGFISCGGGDDELPVPTPAPAPAPTPTPQPNPQIPQHIVNPLTLEAIANGVITYKNRGFYNAWYLIDNGEPRLISPDTNAEIPVSAGQKLTLWGENITCYNPETHLRSNISSTAEFYAYGNVMSLLNGSTEISREYAFAGLFADAITLRSHPTKDLLLPATKLSNHCYDEMFENCKGLTRAPNLPAMSLTSDCYHGMFSGCSSLTTAPALPATELADWCYTGMFYNCDALIAAPVLPATELAYACYSSMFYSCDNLSTAPELPAITLAKSCYAGMFYDCSSLTAAPELPAVTLAEACYYQMFYGCSNLSSAPDLPAEVLQRDCYGNMFAYCRNLKHVKCMATNKSATDCTRNWLYHVAGSGTFVKKTGVSWPRGADGIPNGWTITSK